MMRLWALFLFVFSSIASAGNYYYSNRVDTYDPLTGLYYKAVLDKEERGFMSTERRRVMNIAISDPETGRTVLLFKDPFQGPIVNFMFETGHRDGRIEFYDGSSYVKNNVGIPKRAPKNRLLVVVREGEKKETALSVSEKDGSNLKKLIVVPEGGEWHVDVSNSKLRVVRQTGTTIKIDSVEW